MSGSSINPPSEEPMIARIWQLAPQFILAVVISAYILVFGFLTWNQQSNFGTFGFDMGIYDQGIWLLSRFENPFITVRGLPYFGHHANFSTLLLVPFYWLGAGPRFLYITETIMLAAGAMPLWLLGRHLLNNAWIALFPAIAYLLYPSLEWINRWHFHPDALIITPLLFAWWFARIERWRPFIAAIILALLAKEDAAIAVAAMGVLIAIRACITRNENPEAVSASKQKSRLFQIASFAVNNRSFIAGVYTAIAGIAWWLMCTKLIIPYMNAGTEPFYSHMFPGFGATPLEVIKTIITTPSSLIDAVSTPDHLTYYLKIFSPTAFLSLFSPATLIAAPQLLVNSISAHGYTHDVRYHYNSIVIAGVFLGTIETIAWIGRRWVVAKFILPLVVLISTVISNIYWSPSPLGNAYSSGIWVQPQEKHQAILDALELIPADAAVTTSYYMVPHLTHRKLIYEFPNPFRVANWGIAGENGGNPAEVDYLVIDTRHTGSDTELYESLISNTGPFQVIYSVDKIQVAQRKRSH